MGLTLELKIMGMCAKSFQSCPTFCSFMVCIPPASSVHGIHSDKNTGVDCYAILQGIFPTQGLNQHLISPALAGGFFTTSATWEAPRTVRCSLKSQDNAGQITTWPILRWLWALTVLFLSIASHLVSMKALTHWLSLKGSWPLDRSPPCHTHSPTPPPVPAGIRNKASFLFHQLCLFIGFPAESRGTPLSIIHLFT